MESSELFEDKEFLKRIRAIDLDICPSCHGLGFQSGNGDHSCQHCNGKGWVRNGKHN